MKNDTRREQIIDIVKREFIGPDPLDVDWLVQENGEEIISSDNPLIRYSAGILFPQGIRITDEDNGGDGEEIEDTVFGVDSSEELIHNEESGSGEILEAAEELINLSNSYKQSAISLTVAIQNNDKIKVNVNAATYFSAKIENEHVKTKNVHCRKPLKWINGDAFLNLSNYDSLKIQKDDDQAGLEFCFTFRYSNKNENYSVYTFTLVNTKQIDYDVNKPAEKDCYFQVEFELQSTLGFHQLQDNFLYETNDEDILSNRLLYRSVKNYAIGHGCSSEWTEDEGVVKSIKTTVMPSYEIKPIKPRSFNEDGMRLDMLEMGDKNKFEETISSLSLLCHKYEQWIKENEATAVALQPEYMSTAKRHIDECKLCLNRMRGGLELLKMNQNVKTAFFYMNQAMLSQQLHYKLPLQLWESDDGNNVHLNKKIDTMPVLEDQSSWFDNENQVYGKWRPFQITFILINIKPIVNPFCEERVKVDLIWFPTGGGKTEAYLGLSAFSIFYKKLITPDSTGTSIIMRYTLRLLTAQQYERASSMICACEMIRKTNEKILGKNRITIGLWVGSSTTPNKMSEAVSEYDRMYRGASTENPFGVLKCPWCGAQMGIINTKSRTEHLKGYFKQVTGSRKRIIFKCDNPECDFSHSDYPLPLFVVDEAIYESPPTLIIGTVDKFAMLPYWPEAQKIFGIENGDRKTPPDLIIQDELHLISGPLGSMVGHYETMINALCCRNTDKGILRPKIIASTATISRAKEQCHALYDCGRKNVIQFPPSGIDAGESFFAYTDRSAAGRQYVGIFAPGASSHATTNIRLYATLLYAAKALKIDDEAERDAYWTNLGYYNSLRELGQAATWVSADITEYLHTIYKRRFEDIKEKYKENRRYIYREEELTSRIRSDKISSSLQNLSVFYPSTDERPIDLCLATNMISVGVDIPRLGLMTVAGQPKTSAEYIQATSRVGRTEKAPGLIFTVYNPGKPRDRSHYEHFRAYHSKIYSYVEPTSVTPFSSPLRARALHAIIFGLVRLLGDKATYNDPKQYPQPERINEIKTIIKNRVNTIDESEFDNTIKQIDRILELWRIQSPEKYHDFSARDPVPLMYPAGKKPNINWEGRGFETPMSMRSVDLPCEVFVLPNGYEKRGE